MRNENNIMTYIDGCSLTAGHFDGLPPWVDFVEWRYPPVINNSWCGKNNLLILQDALDALEKYPNLKEMIIYWTYSERRSLYDLNHPRKQPHRCVNKQLLQDIINSEHHRGMYWLGRYIHETAQFMYILQKACRDRKVELIMMTVEPYYMFEYATNYHKKINSYNVINWNDSFKPCVREADMRWVWWAYKLNTLFCARHEVFDRDLQHPNAKGQALFAEDFMRCYRKGERDQFIYDSDAQVIDWVRDNISYDYSNINDADPDIVQSVLSLPTIKDVSQFIYED